MIKDKTATNANDEYIELKKQLDTVKVDIKLVHKTILLAIQQGHTSDCDSLIKLAYKVSPNNLRNEILQALFLYKKSQYSAAAKILSSCIEKQPNATEALILIANIKLKQKCFPAAIKYYCRVIQLEPNNTDAKYNCALAYCENNNIKHAKDLLNEIINIEPDHIKTLGMLGQIALEEKLYQEACDYFSKRLMLDQTHANTWHSLAQTEFLLKQFQESTTSYQNCLYHMPNHPTAHYELATAYIQLGMMNEATKHYHLQIEIQPDKDTFYNLAVCFMYQEKVNDAIYFFTQTVKLEPNTEAAHINLGSLYIKNNNIKQAKHHYTKALAISPGNLEVKHILSAITGTAVSLKAPKEYVASLFNQYAHYYDQHLVKHLDYQAHKLLLKYIDTEHWEVNSLNILDLGCGTGLCGYLFSSYAKQLIGVDLSAKMITMAKSKNIYDKLINEEILLALPQITRQNIILAADVLTYFGELNELLTKCYSSLSENGIMAFTVESLHQDSPYILQSSIRYAHNHTYIKKTLQEIGFIDITINTTVLRHQFKQPVNGYTVIAKKPNT